VNPAVVHETCTVKVAVAAAVSVTVDVEVRLSWTFSLARARILGLFSASWLDLPQLEYPLSSTSFHDMVPDWTSGTLSLTIMSTLSPDLPIISTSSSTFDGKMTEGSTSTPSLMTVKP